MITWTTIDKDSGIEFSIHKTDTGKLQLDCKYNRLKIDIRHYEFGKTALEALEFLIANVIGDLFPRKVKVPKKKKKK